MLDFLGHTADQVYSPDQRFVHNIIMTPYLAQTLTLTLSVIQNAGPDTAPGLRTVTWQHARYRMEGYK